MLARPIHIALPWHNLGHGNLGIDALTRANIAILRAAAVRAGRTARFTTLCAQSRLAADAIDADVTVGPMPSPKAILLGRSSFLKVLKSADLVVDIGEGDSWADIYGGTRFAFHAGTKIAALIQGRPLVLAPQTIGPFDTGWRRRLADAIMNRSRAVFARDDMSFAYLQDHANRTETAEFIDVAFALPFTPHEKEPGALRVGLNISGLLYRGGYHGANQFGLTIDYADLMHRTIEAFLEKGAEIHMIPHVIAYDGNDDDRSILPTLRERYPGLIEPAPFESASAAKSYMSGLDFVVGGRMHACIGAFSAGVPVVPIAYSRKFNGLFGTLGYRHYVDGRAVDTDMAFAAILVAFERREQLAVDIASGLTIAKTRLDAYEARLASIIAELA